MAPLRNYLTPTPNFASAEEQNLLLIYFSTAFVVLSLVSIVSVMCACCRKTEDYDDYDDYDDDIDIDDIRNECCYQCVKTGNYCDKCLRKFDQYKTRRRSTSKDRRDKRYKRRKSYQKRKPGDRGGRRDKDRDRDRDRDRQRGGRRSVEVPEKRRRTSEPILPILPSPAVDLKFPTPDIPAGLGAVEKLPDELGKGSGPGSRKSSEGSGSLKLRIVDGVLKLAPADDQVNVNPFAPAPIPAALPAAPASPPAVPTNYRSFHKELPGNEVIKFGGAYDKSKSSSKKSENIANVKAPVPDANLGGGYRTV